MGAVPYKVVIAVGMPINFSVFCGAHGEDPGTEAQSIIVDLGRLPCCNRPVVAFTIADAAGKYVVQLSTADRAWLQGLVRSCSSALEWLEAAEQEG